MDKLKSIGNVVITIICLPIMATGVLIAIIQDAFIFGYNFTKNL